MTPTSDPQLSPEHLSVPQELRFYRAGLPLSETNHVFICLHGYGQLVKYFMRKFHSLEDRVHLVFPEAMHRFYLQGNGGRVGASWMTKEDRLIDIANQSRFLDQLHQHVLGASKAKVTVIGFSQGAATASRWACGTEQRINNLVLWSSAFPPDLLALDNTSKLNELSVYQFIGTEDPYLKESKGSIQTEFKTPSGIESEFLTFDGGHEIRPSELEILADRILS